MNTSRSLKHLGISAPDSSSSWGPFLPESLCRRAIEAALFVAERMRDLEYVQKIATLAQAQSIAALGWDHRSPSCVADLALFYNHLARTLPEDRWLQASQFYLKQIGITSQRSPLQVPALIGGICGVALTLQLASEEGRRYQKTLTSLHRFLAEQMCARPGWQIRSSTGVAEADYDLVAGASGIVGYLIGTKNVDEYVDKMLDTLLDYLLWLTEPGQKRGQERWLCAASLLVDTRDIDLYPHGRFNCGLAHGIPGPLAALALLALTGYHRPGLHESIAFVSSWLLQHQLHDRWGPTWTSAIPQEYAASPDEWNRLPAARCAWCYGPPGVARSLWLAGLALADDALCQSALLAIKSVLHRPIAERNIDAPTLCHGRAGLLLICLHFAHESQDAELKEAIPTLVEQILAQFDPSSPLGFRDIEPPAVMVDKPALLTGAPGTALALLAAATALPPRWDRLLLLS